MNTILLNTISRLNQTQPIREENPNKFGIPRLKTLHKDTISFGLSAAEKKRRNEEQKPVGEVIRRLVSCQQQEKYYFKRVCQDIFPGVGVEPGMKPSASIFNKIMRYGRPNPATGKVDTISYNQALEHITDLGRIRIVTSGSHESINNVVRNIIGEIEKGTIRLTEIRNYRGEIIPASNMVITPYLSGENITDLFGAQMKKLRGGEEKHIVVTEEVRPDNEVELLEEVEKQAPKSARAKALSKEKEKKTKPKEPIVKEERGKLSNSYTALHLLGQTKNGLNFEIQIKGEHVKYVDDATHILHDIDAGKAESIKIRSAKERAELMPIIEAYTSLTQDKVHKGKVIRKGTKTLFSEYLYICYDVARKAELNPNLLVKGKLHLPNLPRGISEVLNIHNLVKVARKFGRV